MDRALGQQARDQHGSQALTAAAPQCAEEEERSRFHCPRGRAAASRGFPSFPPVGEQVLPAGAVPFWLPARSPALLKALQEPPLAFPPAGYFQRGFLVLFKVQLPPSSAAPCPGDLRGSCCISPPRQLQAGSGALRLARTWPLPGSPRTPSGRGAGCPGAARCLMFQQAGTPQNTGI